MIVVRYADDVVFGFQHRQEAERFTPGLRVLDYTGPERNGDDFASYDAILATYGTLRRDAVRLKDVEFDYVVLDEAQAVKNADTESAKAVRLLRAEHRLALSGTPVQTVVVTGAAHVLDFGARLQSLQGEEIDLADLLADDPTDRHLDADIDPTEDLFVVFMTQLIPSGTFDFRGQLRALTYAAIAD